MSASDSLNGSETPTIGELGEVWQELCELFLHLCIFKIISQIRIYAEN